MQLAHVYLTLSALSLIGTIEYLQFTEPWLVLVYIM